MVYQIIHGEPEPLPASSGIDPELARITSRCLSKDPEDRYRSAADLAADLEKLVEGPAKTPSLSGLDPGRQKPRRHLLRNLTISSAVLGIIITAVIILTPSQGIPFSMRDWILITDFENQTGEEIFQGTVSEALSIDLQQSQYVNIFSGKRLRDALFRSGNADATVINAELGREIAIREGVPAVLEGKISRVGDVYTLSARLVVPTTGDAVDTKRIRVHSREEFLGAVDELSRDIRRNLGESMLSIRRRDQPLAEVTTGSLQALRYYTLSQQQSRIARWEKAIPLLEQAVAIDTTFATALNDLAVLDQNLLRITDALRFSQQAYRHRERSPNGSAIISRGNTSGSGRNSVRPSIGTNCWCNSIRMTTRPFPILLIPTSTRGNTPKRRTTPFCWKKPARQLVCVSAHGVGLRRPGRI